jgi:uncharacterized protein (DUF1800 family)
MEGAMEDPQNSSGLNRREVLKLGGVFSAAGLGSPFDDQLKDSGELPPPSMRNLEAATETRVVDPPPLPPLVVIANNRMAFGQRFGDYTEFSKLGSTPEERLDAFIEQQLAPESIDDSNCDEKISAAGFTTLDKSLQELWADHFINYGDDYSYRRLPITETEKATFIRAVYSKRQLLEVLVDFWHNHFNVYGWSYYIAPTFVFYDRSVIRKHALGNFREILGAVAKSPAMLYYLDNYKNSRAGPNENFARELFELHTLGAENYLGVKRQSEVPVDGDGIPIGYVDDDVYEAARCFTGWRVDYSTWEEGVGQSGTFLFYSDWHDEYPKRVLGVDIASYQGIEDGEIVLDTLAAHLGTARYIARKLCRRLISDNPPENLVNEAAQVFHANVDKDDQLKRVVRTILKSEAFRNTWGQKVKRPFEAAVSMLRITNADFVFSNEFGYNYDDMGQPLFSHAAPDGYSDIKEDWVGTVSMLERWNLFNRLIEIWIDDIYMNLVSMTPSQYRTPVEIADHWISHILGRSMHPAENRQAIIDFMAQGRNPDYDLPDDLRNERIPRMVALILMSPDFQIK